MFNNQRVKIHLFGAPKSIPNFGEKKHRKGSFWGAASLLRRSPSSGGRIIPFFMAASYGVHLMGPSMKTMLFCQNYLYHPYLYHLSEIEVIRHSNLIVWDLWNFVRRFGGSSQKSCFPGNDNAAFSDGALKRCMHIWWEISLMMIEIWWKKCDSDGTWWCLISNMFHANGMQSWPKFCCTPC